MATFGDLPCVLLYQILFLLVQSSLSAVDFARIISVCRDFFSYADDESLLKAISFDSRMDCKMYCRFQHFNGLLVRCSRVGNISAQILLGKVILLSSPQLFVGRWQIRGNFIEPYSLAMLGQNIAADQYARIIRDISFVNYFFPTQASTSESSETRLVHNQLVKVFLENASYHDIIEIEEYLESYLLYFQNHDTNGRLFIYFDYLVSAAADLRILMKLVKLKPKFVESFWAFQKVQYGGTYEDTSSYSALENLAREHGDNTLRFQNLCEVLNLDYAAVSNVSDEEPLQIELHSAFQMFIDYRELVLSLFYGNFA